MITERAFFWRFAMMPIVLPVLALVIIWLLDEVVKISGFFAGALMFIAGSGLVGGVPYLLTILAVFAYTRLFSAKETNYVRIGLFMPLIFVLFMHAIVIVLSIIDDFQNLGADSFIQMNLNFLPLDLVGFLVASIYTLFGIFLLGHFRKKNKIRPAA